MNVNEFLINIYREKNESLEIEEESASWANRLFRMNNDDCIVNFHTCSINRGERELSSRFRICFINTR